MAAIQGYNGTVGWRTGSRFSDYTTTNVRNWNLDYVADVLDTTIFTSSGDRSFIGGLRGWSGTFECLLDGTTLILSDANGLGRRSAVASSDTLTFTASTGRTYAGQAFVSGIHPSIAVDGVNVVTVDVQGTSDLTIA